MNWTTKIVRGKTPGEYLRRLLNVTWDEFGSQAAFDLLGQAKLRLQPYPSIPITRVYRLDAMDAFVEDDPSEHDESMFNAKMEEQEDANVVVFDVFDLSQKAAN